MKALIMLSVMDSFSAFLMLSLNDYETQRLVLSVMSKVT